MRYRITHDVECDNSLSSRTLAELKEDMDQYVTNVLIVRLKAKVKKDVGLAEDVEHSIHQHDASGERCDYCYSHARDDLS
jgi:hypothetical protein